MSSSSLRSLDSPSRRVASMADQHAKVADAWKSLWHFWTEACILFLSAHYEPHEGIARFIHTQDKKKLLHDLDAHARQWSRLAILSTPDTQYHQPPEINLENQYQARSKDTGIRPPFFLQRMKQILHAHRRKNPSESSSRHVLPSLTTASALWDHKQHHRDTRNSSYPEEEEHDGHGGRDGFPIHKDTHIELQSTHLYLCCEKWYELYQGVWQVLEKFLQHVKQCYQIQLRQNFHFFRVCRKQLQQQFGGVVEQFNMNEARLKLDVNTKQKEWAEEYHQFQQTLYQWISGLHLYQRAISKLLQFPTDTDTSNNNMKAFHKTHAKHTEQTQRWLHQLETQEFKQQDHHDQTQLFDMQTHILKHAKRMGHLWNLQISQEPSAPLTRQLEHCRMRISHQYEHTRSQVAQQRLTLQKLKQSQQHLLDEERCCMNQARTVQQLTPERMQMHLLIQTQLNQLKPQLKAESNRLETLEDQLHDIRKFKHASETAPPQLRSTTHPHATTTSTTTLVTCEGMEHTLSNLKLRFHGLVQYHHQEMQRILEEDEASSRALMDHHIHEYVKWIKEMQLQFDRQVIQHRMALDTFWNQKKPDIYYVEQHMNQYYKSAWSDPDLYDDVQFLSDTLTHSQTLLERYIHQSLTALRIAYAHQCLDKLRKLIEKDGHT